MSFALTLRWSFSPDLASRIILEIHATHFSIQAWILHKRASLTFTLVLLSLIFRFNFGCLKLGMYAGHLRFWTTSYSSVLSDVKQRPAWILSTSLSWIGSLVITDKEVSNIILASVLIVIQFRPFRKIRKIEFREIWSRARGTGFQLRSIGAIRLATIAIIMMRLKGSWGFRAVSILWLPNTVIQSIQQFWDFTQLWGHRLRQNFGWRFFGFVVFSSVKCRRSRGRRRCLSARRTASLSGLSSLGTLFFLLRLLPHKHVRHSFCSHKFNNWRSVTSWTTPRTKYST